MKRRILILTECGSEIGFGHLTRCQSLAHAFGKAGWESELWLKADAAASAYLSATARLIDWHRMPLEQIAGNLLRADAVLVDSYTVPPTQLASITALAPQIAVVDDWPRRDYQHGIVIDWTIGAERYAYPQRSAHAHYLLGSRYCAIRPEFSEMPPRHFASAPRSVMVSFGGSDIRRLTAPVAVRLHQEFPDLHLNVVVGGGVADPSLAARLAAPHISVHSNCNALKMRYLMTYSDLAICAGGQTLYELASQGLPPVVVGVIDNQNNDICEFAEAGFATAVGDWQRPDLLDSIVAALRSLWPTTKRKGHAAAGRACIDGRGTERLVRACIGHWQFAQV